MSQSQAACRGPATNARATIVPPKVILVSGQVRTRVGLGRLLARETQATVVSTVERALLRMAARRPDWVVITPDTTYSGVEQMRQLLSAGPPVIVLGSCGPWLDRHRLRHLVVAEVTSHVEVLTVVTGGRPQSRP